ncbi:MAG: glycosyltransferase family 4 protein [Verrucomicrobiae bacterium]|nr:glycosyltransferase family 4 protein [Verrucomicrobiae bacterium]
MSDLSSQRYHLAYVFERFPSFTQTFCVREILELERQGLRPLLFSIRDTRKELPRHFPEELFDRVIFLPPEKELVEEVKRLKAEDKLPKSVVLTLRHWKEKPDTRDKQRVYEAAWIGQKLAEAGVRHVHSHFAGIGARTGWWLKFLYDVTYSFTGHANDLWEKQDLPLALDQLMRDAALVATVSDYSARDLRERFPHAAGRVKRVYNGLDLTPFRAAAERRNSDSVWKGERLILSVGRLIEKKGYDDLVRACGLLQKMDVGDFRCVIVGDGPMEDELNALIAQLHLGERVVLAGPKSQEEIIELLEQTAVFALPCVTEREGGKDNLPTVIMEAMAARVACASTILAGVPEMVIEGQTGRLVPERQPEAFAEILRDLLASPEATEAMGRAGYELAAQIFAKEATAKSLRRHLVSYGLTRFDVSLISADPMLAIAYLKQFSRRIARLFRHQAKDRVG